MFVRPAKLLLVLSCVAALGFAQPYGANASKDDWEEINFEFNSAVLTDGFPSLLRLAELLQKNPGYRVALQGHADYIGSDRYNLSLGERRAEAVRDFLIKYGAQANQIQLTTEGESDPKVAARTKEARFVNRRVSMTVRNEQGQVVGAGGVREAIDGFKEAFTKQQQCCEEILKRLDRLDEIAAMLKNMASENAGLKQELGQLRKQHEALEQQVAGLPKPLTRQETVDITRTTTAEEIERARMKRFTLLNLNAGVDDNGDLTFTGRGRYFAPFKDRFAIQAEGEYMYWQDRKEGQFDIGLVTRVHPRFQAGLFSSFKHVTFNEYASGGTLGQASVTLDYLFSRGRVGVWGSKGFMQNAVLQTNFLTRNMFEEIYLRTVDQVGASTTLGLWGPTYLEANLGYLKSFAHADRPGGTARFVFPLSDRLAFTLEGGVNETLLARDNYGRVVAGLQFGNFIRPTEYMAVDHPVPADIPRVRYELLTRRVRTGNDAPVAFAGTDMIGVAAGLIQLDGSASFDPEGDPITFEWTQVAGPGVGLNGANTAKPSFNAEAGQSYGFRLLVKDNQGAQSIDRVTVTTREVPQIQILRFAASPAGIVAGQTANLTWQVQNADEVTITGLGRVAQSGTAPVSPASTTTYTLTARNEQSQASEQLTITVDRPQPRFLACTAQPMTILAGESATLFFSAQNADSVSISGIGTVEPSGTRTVTPATTTTYALTANSQFGDTSCTVTVTVTPGESPRVVRLAAEPAQIERGQSATLLWAVENADEVTITGIGSVPATGTRTVSPAQNTTYTLTARNRFGESTTAATVTVVEPPPPPPPAEPQGPATITNCVATPPVSPLPGSPVQLSWTATNHNAINITGLTGRISLSGPVTVYPTSDYVFTIQAVGPPNTIPALCQVPVTVTQPPATTQPPAARIAGPEVINTTNRTITLDATGSTNPGGGALTYIWVPLNPNAQATEPGSPTTTINITGMTGSYPIRLTVRNAAGQASNALVTIDFRSTPAF